MRKIIFICDKCGKEKEWNNQCKELFTKRKIELCQDCRKTYEEDCKKRDADIQAITQESQRMVQEVRDKFAQKWSIGADTSTAEDTMATSKKDGSYQPSANGNWEDIFRTLFPSIF